MLLINPDSGIYRDIPNLSLAYAAAALDANVVDLNAQPEPADRYLAVEDAEVLLSVRSNTERAAQTIRARYAVRYPRARVSSVRNAVDVLCCYPFKDWPGGVCLPPEFGDALPLPRYDRFDSLPLFQANWRSGAWPYYLLTSLGCPFRCTYCASRKRPWRRRSVAHCMEELREAKARWGIRRFDVIDDCFNADRDRVLEFCEQAQALDLPWTCANGLRADRFDEAMARALKRSGCRYLSFGVESLDDTVLKTNQKGETAEQITQAIVTAQKYFPGRVNGFFIIGLPGSSYASDLGTLRWAIRQGISANFSFYVDHESEAGADPVFSGEHAAPRSEAYDRALQQKLYDYTSYMRRHKGRRLKPLFHTLGTLRLILAFDPWRLPMHLWRYGRARLAP